MLAAELLGVDKLLSQLAKLVSQAPPAQTSVITGYTGKQAIWVHELVAMKLKGKPRRGRDPSGRKRKGNYWDPPGKGRAKFLESAARDLQTDVEHSIVNACKSGVPLDDALVIGALMIQREGQLRVPVDTGDLKNRAFTRKE